MAAPKERESCPSAIGGQAVIEGVMMRAPGRVATAVRVAPDHIVVRCKDYVSLTRRFRILGLPILRGAVSLIESLVIGTSTLNWSAEVTQQCEEQNSPSALHRTLFSLLTVLIGLFFALGLFMYLPYLLTSLAGFGANQLVFHLVVGVIRVCLLLGYLRAIGIWGDVERLFQYHGAEHKAIYSWEEEQAVEVPVAETHSRFHPRCGTSFLLLVALSTVLVYALFDTAWVARFGEFHSVLHRLLVHLPVVPLVAGFAFEMLQLSNRLRSGAIVRTLIAPGLWLQRLTTREPFTEQVEVAVVAIRASLGLPMDGLKSRIEFL